MKDSDLLATVPIFSALSANVLDELLSRMTKRSYQKNNMILMEDEFGDTFFIIAGGSIKITRVSEDGREVILAMLGEGEFFGEMSLLDGETRSANAIAIEESKVLILKRHDFLLFLERFPKIAISLLTEMAGRIRKSDQQIESLSLSDAEHRIGITLIRMAEELGTIRQGKVEISNLPYQQDIANMAGTSRETVSRMMKILEEKGFIKRSGHNLSILDYSQFKRTFN
ncbi:MAG TPA: Crp/Fnr family transcriptional regulator [Candidatus Marinimicrobia bacterium]|jgi:CRP-like cAMP-binding protein|nr:MAG: Crp/Fnr family transcriptional regulator [Candidatus Neomarinimicrobiota bacterium]HIA29246.1 Crp/Fnr family transcriptional regulator [Candidatus Neomarinimicrobiota bacterium]HIA86260.1 Crp/Fnr family transcriptional regulator [Candidatus Neomarinimicrobiota bacterium]HIB58854.1 Crp/Fnr family transcriptional regulator [Candidatus Neomarinimicrobiota bacterium]HIC51617.1 Crp/Fnr family transcriptional regulator [Candidatus Neomarinimicrobiota bacterium]